MNFYNNPYGYNSPYNNYQPQQVQPQQQAQPQMRTNKIFVTSLEDALNRFAEPNTIIVYRHQDEKLEFEVATDGQGKKTYKTLEIRPYLVSQDTKTEEPSVISKEEFNAIKSRIDTLEKEILNRYKQEIKGKE